MRKVIIGLFLRISCVPAITYDSTEATLEIKEKYRWGDIDTLLARSIRYVRRPIREAHWDIRALVRNHSISSCASSFANFLRVGMDIDDPFLATSLSFHLLSEQASPTLKYFWTYEQVRWIIGTFLSIAWNVSKNIACSSRNFGWTQSDCCQTY